MKICEICNMTVLMNTATNYSNLPTFATNIDWPAGDDGGGGYGYRGGGHY